MELQKIYATTISRIEQHARNGYVATITAFITSDNENRPYTRTQRSHKSNKSVNYELGRALQQLGYGYSRIVGYWNESGYNSGGEADREETYYVICPKSLTFETFTQDMIDLASDFEQQAVVVWNGKENVGYLYGTDDYTNYVVWDEFHTFNVEGEINQAWSQYKDRAFTFANSTVDAEFYINSATELTNCASGATPMVCAAHYRKLWFGR